MTPVEEGGAVVTFVLWLILLVVAAAAAGGHLGSGGPRLIEAVLPLPARVLRGPRRDREADGKDRR